jgi:hypothetical protein
VASAALLAVLITIFTIGLPAPSAIATPGGTSYDTASYIYDAPAQLSSPDTAATTVRGSPPVSQVASWEGCASTRGCCTAADSVADSSSLWSRFRSLPRDERGSIRIPGGGTPLTNAQAADMAARVGFTRTNFIMRGQTVFTNGKTFIVQDTTSHSGGLWKMARTVEGLGSKGSRMGTYDYNLEYIGP